jgi:hypothetical protein
MVLHMKLRPHFLLLVLVYLLTISQPAAAWGRKGHEAIAIIAEANLTVAAQAQVKALLKNDLDKYDHPSGRTTMPEIASWADEIRDATSKNSYRGWHTRENPVCSTKLGPCPMGGCVNEKLLHYVAVLKNKHASHRDRNEALKFVVHLVGDLHAPLHSGSNYDKTGHFPATLEGRTISPKSTLHSIWDHNLLTAGLKKRDLSVKLDTTEKLAPDAIMQWMLETREVSRKYVYDPLPDFSCGKFSSDPIVLSRAYQKQAIPVIRRQIRRAGLRLAQLLNESLV